MKKGWAFFLLLCAGPVLSAEVEVSTVTGNAIRYNGQKGLIEVDGKAYVDNSTATLKADKIFINPKSKTGEAQGKVEIIQSSQTIKGDKAKYNWERSTGVVQGAKGVAPPWRFEAQTLQRTGPDEFLLRTGYITSCNHNPPHYKFRSSRSKLLQKKRANLLNSRLAIGETSVLWAPFHTRSLTPKKYTLRVEPGNSSRDGIIVKSRLGYPFSANTYTNFKWDLFQKTGNGFGLEHRYNNPKIRGNLDSFFVKDHNSDPQPKRRRFGVLWQHYQQLSNRLRLNAKMDFKSDQNFGDEFSGVGNQIRVENEVRGLFSEAGLNYQWPKATLQAQFDRRDRFDTTVSSESFISKITLPRMSFSTIPLEWKYFPVYTSFTANFTNETLNRSNPNQALRYQRSSDVGVQFKRDIRIKKRVTVTPSAGYAQSWQDRDLTVINGSEDIYLGRFNTGVDVRTRFRRLADFTVSHDYVGRTKRNRTDQDTPANDRGVETNRIRTVVVSRIGRNSRVSLSSGYDLRKRARNDVTQFKHTSERIISPVLDIQAQVTPKVSVFFRETYSLFNNSLDRPERTPSNTSGEIQYGEIGRSPYISQGFSYTKGASGALSVLNLNNKLRFFVTTKWYVDVFLSYRAEARNGVNYKKIRPVEKGITVYRDLHCWLIRVNYSQRPNNNEVSFHIDLKTNVKGDSDIFKRVKGTTFYPKRDVAPDITEVFPQQGEVDLLNSAYDEKQAPSED